MESYVLGIDIGGTGIKAGLFDKRGKLCEKWQFPTNKSENGKYILKETAEFILEKSTGKKIDAMGIGVPGPVDEKGVAAECVNLGWGRTDVKAEMESLTGIKTYVLNDANAAALGELTEDCQSMVFVTIGTGVGGGIVLDGRVINGFNGAAGEIGHINVNSKEREKCTCGKCGCLEQYASATGMKKYAQRLIAEGMETGLKNDFEAKDIAELAEKGDMLCLKVIDFMAYNMALALSMIACTINPKEIVIGGGVSKAGDTILEPIKKYFRKFAFPSTADTLIRKAQMGNDAGIYGAAKEAIKHI